MKKYFIIIALSLLQGACSVSYRLQGDSHTLLGYTELATEITVGFEQLEMPQVIGNETHEALDSP